MTQTYGNIDTVRKILAGNARVDRLANKATTLPMLQNHWQWIDPAEWEIIKDSDNVNHPEVLQNVRQKLKATCKELDTA